MNSRWQYNTLLSYLYLGLNLQSPDDFILKHFLRKRLYPLHHVSSRRTENEFSGFINQMFSSVYEILSFFIKPFWLMFPKSDLSLYLAYSTAHYGPKYAEEGRKTYRPKLCEYNNKHENNSLNILSDENSQTSSELREINGKCPHLQVFDFTLCTAF